VRDGREAGGDVKVLFGIYLVGIAIGIAYFVAIGLSHS
jgi:hypothetical protein